VLTNREAQAAAICDVYDDWLLACPTNGAIKGSTAQVDHHSKRAALAQANESQQ
jgi:hypothetical protein